MKVWNSEILLKLLFRAGTGETSKLTVKGHRMYVNVTISILNTNLMGDVSFDDSFDSTPSEIEIKTYEIFKSVDYGDLILLEKDSVIVTSGTEDILKHLIRKLDNTGTEIKKYEPYYEGWAPEYEINDDVLTQILDEFLQTFKEENEASIETQSNGWTIHYKFPYATTSEAARSIQF
jgi:vancomycin resistance protein YoaR